MDLYEQLARAAGFEWDAGNLEKNWVAHQVSPAECEQTFFNQPVIAAVDPNHSQSEPRYFLLGRTDAGRLLFVAFTLRQTLIRTISARDMSRMERKVYGDL